MVAFATINLGEMAVQAGDFHAGLDYSKRAADLFRDLGDDGGLIMALGNCGWSSLGLSNPVRAAAFFREALVSVAPVNARTSRACVAVFGLAAALVALHEEERGAQLLGAAAWLRDELGIGFHDEQEEQSHERTAAEAKAALGGETFATAWAQGEAMTPEEILAFAQAG